MDRRPALKTALAAGLLLTVVLVAYVPAMQGGFVWDDDDYVTDNWTLRSREGLLNIWIRPSSLPQYYPLVHTSFWIEYRLWGLSAFGYHVVNVLLHGLCAVLLWKVLRRLSVPAAWFAAAIFALHPVHVESVAWITERKNVLSGVLVLASLLAYWRFAFNDHTDGSARSWRHYIISVVFYVAALASKTVSCALPAAVLLLLWWKRGRLRARDIVPLLPMFVVGIAAGALTAWLEVRHVGASGHAWELTFLERCLIAGRALCFYGGKLLWPAQLTFIYPRWHVDATVWWQYIYPAFVLICIFELWSWRRVIGVGPLVAVLLFAGSLLPALGFFNIYPMIYSFVADHFQYLASMPLIALLTVFLVTLFRRLLARRASAGMALKPEHLLAVVVLVLGMLTWFQGAIYKDVQTLWRDTLDKNPGAWMAHNNLGVLLVERGELEAGMQHFRSALQIQRDDSVAHYNLGRAYDQRGDGGWAESHYRQALQLAPDYVDAHGNLGLLLFHRGQQAEAERHFEQALEIDPHYFRVHNNLGMLLVSLGRTDEGISHYREALRYHPDYLHALNNLAWVLATDSHPTLRDPAEAVILAERACALRDFEDAVSLDTLAAAYAAAGDFNRALASAKQAVELARANGYTNLAADIELRRQSYAQHKAYTSPSSQIP